MQIQLPELQPEAERVSGSVESKRLPYELPVDLHLRRRREIVPLDRKRLLEIGSTCDHWESGRRRRGWADWRTDVVDRKRKVLIKTDLVSRYSVARYVCGTHSDDEVSLNAGGYDIRRKVNPFDVVETVRCAAFHRIRSSEVVSAIDRNSAENNLEVKIINNSRAEQRSWCIGPRQRDSQWTRPIGDRARKLYRLTPRGKQLR